MRYLSRRFTHTFAGIAAISVVTAGLAVGLHPTAALAAQAPNAPARTEEYLALAKAKATGDAVSLASKTTPVSQIEALPDGTLRLTSNTFPVRALRDGKWRKIDTHLEATDRGIEPAVALNPTVFSAGGDSALMSIQTESGKWISESWDYGDLPSPKLKANVAIYSDVFEGVDLRLEATASGLSETLVIKTPAAGKNKQLQTVRLGLSGGKFQQNAAREIRSSSSDALVASAPVWWDSSGHDASVAGPGGDLPVQPVDQEVTADSVVLGLGNIVARPELKYPLYVDPDWNVGQQAFWFTDRAFPNTTYLNGQNASAGYQSVGAATQSGKSYMSRAFWQFGVGDLIGKQILAASFNVRQTYSVRNSGSQVQLWRYGPVGAGFTWNSDPGAWAQQLDSRLLPYGDGANAASWVGLNAAAGVAAVTGAGGGTLQLGLRSSNEGDQSGRKHYDFGASLTVTYNSTPGTPASPQLTSPVRSCSTDPANPTPIDATQPMTMQVNASDPDGGQNLETWFAVYGVTQPSYSWAKPSPRIAAGPVSMTVPANTLISGDYRWQSQTNDGVGGVGPVSVWCYLRTTTSSPTLPTVSRTSAETAVVGKPMTVQFGSAASDGVKVFAYWWAIGTPGTPPRPPVLQAITPGQPLPACGSASGSVRFACPSSGSTTSAAISVAPIDALSTLWVASYNDAGRVSLAANGLESASGLAVQATSDVAGVSLTSGHIWDSQTITSSATSVPDLNTTSGSSGTSTRQLLGSPLHLVDGDYFGLPTTTLNFTAASLPAKSERGAIDTASSFTVSVWAMPTAASAPTTEHVAMSVSSQGSPAFTLGTDSTGAAKFCRTSQVDQVKACAVGPKVSVGGWTMLTGVWDSVNQNLRILTDASLAGSVASKPVPAGDTSSAGWLCVGAACSYTSGIETNSNPWEGDLFRPAIFQGVVSGRQLGSLFSVLSPNDDPPADQTVGATVNLRCDELITRQEIYDYNPSLLEWGDWTAEAGTSAYRAQHWNGIGCRWAYESSGTPVDISVASIVDRGTLAQLRTSAASGVAVGGLGDAAFYVGGELQVFKDGYWLAFRSPWYTSPEDFTDLARLALSHLP